MTILTFNCQGIILESVFNSKKMRLIAKRIKRLNPDVVLLQEVFFPWHKKVFSRLLADKYPYRYLPRNGLLRAGGGLCCFSRYPIAAKEFHAFFRTGFWRDSTWRDKFATKGYAKLKIKIKGVSFYFFNTHLTNNYMKDFWLPNIQANLQKSQLIQLATDINRLSLKTPCFAAGDFNVLPDTDLIKDFLSITNCSDLTRFIKSTMRDRGEKLDYVLFRGDRQISARARCVFKDKKPLSDHLGILVDITI